MKIFVKLLLGLLFDAVGVVFAFDEKYVLTIIFVISGIIMMIIGIIEIIVKEKEKTRQTLIATKEETKRLKIAEEEHTKRVVASETETTKRFQILNDIFSHLSNSMPPEELQKQSNSNVESLNKVAQDKVKNILSEKYFEDEISFYEREKDKKEQNVDRKIDSENDNNEDEVLKFTKFLSQLMQYKRDGNNGN